MTWDDVAAEAARLGREECKERLSSMIGTPAFVALVALVLGDELRAADVVCTPKLAKDAGELAHAAGALWQARMATERLKSLLAKEKLSQLSP